jgi:hypothetical protein
MVWRRGGHVVANGIHVHEPVALLTGVRGSPSVLEAIDVKAATDELAVCARRGDVLYGLRTLDRRGGLAEVLAGWRAIVPAEATLAAELVVEDEPATLAHVLAARPSPGEKEWLVGHARGEGAARVVADHPDHVAAGAGLVVVSRTRARAHDGLRASRWGTAFRVVRGDDLMLAVAFHRFPYDPKAAPLDPAALERELRAELGDTARLEGPLATEWQSVRCALRTADPGPVLPFLDGFAAARGCRAWARARSVEPWPDAIERIDVDLRALRRERR